MQRPAPASTITRKAKADKFLDRLRRTANPRLVGINLFRYE